MGLNIILFGGGQYNFTINILQRFKTKRAKSYRVQLDAYLFFLLEEELKDLDDIEWMIPISTE